MTQKQLTEAFADIIGDSGLVKNLDKFDRAAIKALALRLVKLVPK